jgi:putative membrane protein
MPLLPRSTVRNAAPAASSYASLHAPPRLMPTSRFCGRVLFLSQLAVFLIAALAVSWMPLWLLLVPKPVQRASAHRAALEQFVRSGTRNRTGVLIFVSLAEHYVRIVADEAIAQKVHGSEWQAAVDALTAHMRIGRIAAGLIAAIERCGAVLAEHAPPDGSGDELPNRLYVI